MEGETFTHVDTVCMYLFCHTTSKYLQENSKNPETFIIQKVEADSSYDFKTFLFSLLFKVEFC